MNVGMWTQMKNSDRWLCKIADKGTLHEQNLTKAEPVSEKCKF